MKLVTFTTGAGKDRVGALTDEGGIVDLLKAAGGDAPHFASMLALIETGDAALDEARALAANSGADAILSLDAVRLCTPVPAPPQLRDFMSFEQHLKRAYEILRKRRAAREPDPEAALREFEAKGMFQVPDVWYRQPIYYKGNRFSVIGPEEDVVWPDYARLMDYELEFGVFIGKRGKDIPRERAMDHVFGYSIFNDFSARDTQAVEMPGQLGPAKGKDFDTGNAIGPCIVTADEIEPYDLVMVARVNGEEWSRGHSGTMGWKFEDIIAHVSRSETIHPGEFLASGTVGGGSGLEQERFLSPGDVVELEVEGIGVLRNRIVKQE